MENRKEVMFETSKGVKRSSSEVVNGSCGIERIRADLLFTTQELQGVKHELTITSDAKNQGLGHVSKLEEIHAKVELISIAFLDLKVKEKAIETIELVGKLRNDLEGLRNEKENSKKVVERLTLVYYDASEEASKAKEKFLSTQAALKNAESQLGSLKFSLKEINEKYEIVQRKLREEKWKMSNPSNPLVFLGISIGGSPGCRIFIELFADVTPRTAENFRALCTGEMGVGRMGVPLHYKGTSLDQISKGDFSQGGNIPRGDRWGGESIYGDKFGIENYTKKHSAGALSMASRTSNGSEFFICHSNINKYDGQFCVFGHVVDGMDVLRAIDEVGSASWKPTREVMIVDCGQLC